MCLNVTIFSGLIITQRGRAAAALISAERYSQIEKNLAQLDGLELEAILEESRQALRRS